MLMEVVKFQSGIEMGCLKLLILFVEFAMIIKIDWLPLRTTHEVESVLGHLFARKSRKTTASGMRSIC